MSMQWSDKSISELLTRKLAVPDYQRPYSWTDKEVREFFDDLIKFIDQNGDCYLFGQVIIHNVGDVMYIVDGQQRIATATIFLCVLRDIINERNLPDSDYVKTSIYNAIGFSNSKGFRLTTGPDNKEFFLNYVQLGKHDYLQKHKSDKNLYSAYKTLYEGVISYINARSGNTLDKLEHLVEIFLHKFRVSYVETGELSQAFTIFKTLNARGMPLEVTDLLKNHFFSKIDSEHTYLLENWKDMIHHMETTKNGTTQFIKYYWNSRYRFTREKDLFTEVQKISSSNIVPFLTDLFNSVELYLNIVDPDKHVGIFDKCSVHSLSLLKKFNASSFCPLVIAMVNSNKSSEDVNRVVSAIECLIFRNQILGKKTANSNEIRFSNWALDITNGKSVDDLLSEMYQCTDSDDTIRGTFLKYSPNIATGKLILIEIYNRENHELKINDDGKMVHLEHIMPQNNDIWNVDHVEWKEYHKRLGNMTLLDGTKNIRISNGSFEIKKKAYEDSKIEANHEVAKLDSWGTTDILRRQDKLMEKVLRIWPRGEYVPKPVNGPLDAYYRSQVHHEPREIRSELIIVRNHSWSILSDGLAVKRSDYSVFENHGSGIPIDIREYFGIQDLNPGEKRVITLTFNGAGYSVNLVRKNNVSKVTQMLWGADLSYAFNAACPNVTESGNYPDMLFRKISSDTYEVWFQDA